MDSTIVKKARENIVSQASQIIELSSKLTEDYQKAVDTIVRTQGRVVLSGMGKSGLIAQKIAATLSSTGTPSYFLHAAEALHGDMGMLHKDDVLILISNSGQTVELKDILQFAKRQAIDVIALTGNQESMLAQQSDIVLDISVSREICPNNLAPTSSTLATLCLGDVLAVSIMQKRNFSAADFAKLHPGGSLGRKLLYTVGDMMVSDDLPRIDAQAKVYAALLEMTRSRLGLCLLFEEESLVGVITDGDLRRALQEHDNVLQLSASTIATRSPLTISSDTSLQVAENKMREYKVKALVALDPKSKAVVGILDLFHL